MKRLVNSLLIASAMFLAGNAKAAVINFDELQGNGSIASDYSGLDWSAGWSYYADAQNPYNPSSGRQRVYNYNDLPSISFAAPTRFDGAFFAGPDISTNSFSYYLGGSQVGQSGALTLGASPTFLASGYAGLIDKVVVNSSAPGFWVMDDLKFGGVSAVPEPATWAMMIGGFGAIGGLMRRRRAAGRPALA